MKQLLPKLDGFHHSSNYIPGLDPSDIRATWNDLTADPNPTDYASDEELAAAKAEAKQWAEVEALFEGNLQDLRSFVMGYRAYPNSSLETGAVAHVILGRSASGRVIAIYGIDIWT